MATDMDDLNSFPCSKASNSAIPELKDIRENNRVSIEYTITNITKNRTRFQADRDELTFLSEIVIQ